MAVRSIGFVGFRTASLTKLRRILEEGLGLTAEVTGKDKVGYELPDGTRVEAYDASEPFHHFFTTGPVVGFTVDDFAAARRRLADLGVEFITDAQQIDGQEWIHFRFPDGTVAEVIGPHQP